MKPAAAGLEGAIRIAALLALAAAAACRTPPVPRAAEDSAVPPAEAAAENPAPAAADGRRSELLESLRAEGIAFQDLLGADPFDGALYAGRAIEAYAAGRGLDAVLLARAALGADPGSAGRRRLLSGLEERTGVPPDPEAVLPPAALVDLELRRAEESFFAERLGASLQACRRALAVAPDDPRAWVRLGSVHYALGEAERARAAYARAVAAGSRDPDLEKLLLEKGWKAP